ncbi:MAG TPA: DNA topoisomerase IB [Ideonella sp.]|uniref:DNA topoisomerase IB n=1 Tax=Ideonella sp. TaxID=1929293 RepID=UPI002B640484|nr:DNA topoisomerase IB [Ideonella sp.]HSI49854.1 DNA topoisomerase IB [Ideonella sp.]
MAATRMSRPKPPADEAGQARARSLCWVSDTMPGLRREGAPGRFRYRDAEGRVLRDEDTLARIRSLAIPPAYQDVWICPLPEGHLQATGRDARGRKQYRYHPQWQRQRGESKYEALQRFGLALGPLRDKVRRRLGGDDTPTRERVLATLVRLLDTTWVRIGNEAYARDNGSYGLTTLQNRHARLQGDALRLSFQGKSGVRHALALSDPRVARIVRRCRELPGQELFQYQDEAGEVHRVGSAEVNRWLQEASGEAISAKDFRTWHGSVLALQLALAHCQAEGKLPRGTLGTVIAEVAARLGNTPAVCRKSYVHPAVLALFEAEAACELLAANWLQAPQSLRGLSLAERQLMALLTHGQRSAKAAGGTSLATPKGTFRRRKAPT